jgi:hypothetical protein
VLVNPLSYCVLKLIDQYKEMDFLWKETLAESFEAFLNTGDDPRE